MSQSTQPINLGGLSRIVYWYIFWLTKKVNQFDSAHFSPNPWWANPGEPCLLILILLLLSTHQLQNREYIILQAGRFLLFFACCNNVFEVTNKKTTYAFSFYIWDFSSFVQYYSWTNKRQDKGQTHTTHCYFLTYWRFA